MLRLTAESTFCARGFSALRSIVTLGRSSACSAIVTCHGGVGPHIHDGDWVVRRTLFPHFSPCHPCFAGCLFHEPGHCSVSLVCWWEELRFACLMVGGALCSLSAGESSFVADIPAFGSQLSSDHSSL